jgi:hypothetical protein
MNITASDFARIRWGLGFLLVAAVVGFFITTTAQRLVEKAEASQRQLQAQQRDIRARLARAPEEEKELRSKIILYQQLLDRGIIGQEERLNWVEQIARNKAARRLLDFQYEIAPQKALGDAILPGGAQAGSFEFVASTMALQMPLLHENDLLGFIADLRRSVPAHLMVRDCTIDRVLSGGDRAAAQLRAICSIDWVTVREKRQ